MRLTRSPRPHSLALALLTLMIIYAPLSGCSTGSLTDDSSPVPPTATPSPETIWFSPAVSADLREAALNSGTISPVTDQADADVHLDVQSPESTNPPSSTWIYALVAPFPTVPDGVTSDEIRHSWTGQPTGPFAGRPLWMEQATLDAFTALWGVPAPGAVKVASAEGLLDAAWADWPSWGIVPFEALQPRWKVLAIDGQSPIHKDFDPAAYLLSVPFQLEPAVLALPATNRDPTRMTVLVMTGVTALVRRTAARMEEKGITYPAERIGDWLRSADITHISNEVSFVEGCPTPDANSGGLVFCSDPDYMALLQDVGTDVVELTGNHMNDWGISKFRLSLELYARNNLPTFGGGTDLAEALRPLTLENNGNKLAFIGCNFSPVPAEMATETDPGSAPCGDFVWMVNEITRLHSEGYLPIATFQYSEYYISPPPENQVRDFGQMADAGAAIVSGSQSHFPMAIEFKGETFIHYGLGNLFFDQMNYEFTDGTVTTGTRREFIDRYVIYDNRVISVELLTAMLEDYSQPRPMTDIERAQLLEDIFSASGWR